MKINDFIFTRGMFLDSTRPYFKNLQDSRKLHHDLKNTPAKKTY